MTTTIRAAIGFALLNLSLALVLTGIQNRIAFWSGVAAVLSIQRFCASAIPVDELLARNWLPFLTLPHKGSDIEQMMKHDDYTPFGWLDQFERSPTPALCECARKWLREQAAMLQLSRRCVHQLPGNAATVREQEMPDAR